MEEKRIDAVKKWPEFELVQDIQVFINFANFYQRFIKSFSRIAAPLTAMLKTTGSSIASASKVDNNEFVGDKDAVNQLDMSRQLVKSKSRTKSGNNLEEPKFLTSKAKKTFNRLKQAFTEALIFQHFDPECYIQIKTDASNHTIGGVLSQLTPNQVTLEEAIESNVDWHRVAYFSRKMIPAEIRYKTHNGELLAIVGAFKTWRHYLERCKYEVLVLINYNNLRQFIDTKSLSSRQVRWAQELSQYHFQNDYHQGKANKDINALLQYTQRSAKGENTLRSKNVKILHRLQSLLARLSGLLVDLSQLSPLHQILICGTTILP